MFGWLVTCFLASFFLFLFIFYNRAIFALPARNAEYPRMYTFTYHPGKYKFHESARARVCVYVYVCVRSLFSFSFSFCLSDCLSSFLPSPFFSFSLFLASFLSFYSLSPYFPFNLLSFRSPSPPPPPPPRLSPCPFFFSVLHSTVHFLVSFFLSGHIIFLEAVDIRIDFRRK